MTELMHLLPEGEPDELYYLQEITKGLDEEEIETFANVYRAKRQTPQTFLLVAAVGFVGFAGIQRFLAGQIGMGLLYFFTGGLCGIGTILDMVNHKKLALEYNMNIAQDTAVMIDRAAYQ